MHFLMFSCSIWTLRVLMDNLNNTVAYHFCIDANPVCEPQFNTHEIIGSNSCGIKPNQLIISCTVNYNGNEVPLLEWRRASDNISVREGVTNGTKDNNRMVYNLTINENSTAMDVDYYLCSTTRSTTSNGGCKSGKIEVKRTGRGQHVCTCACMQLLSL